MNSSMDRPMNQTSPADSPRRLGDFEILRELGRGGMGVVYEARQVSLNRRVALKVLGPQLGLMPRAVERFHREAEATARLHHTNVVPVYATGEQGGTHYYAMELVEGPSLDQVIRQLRGPQARNPAAEQLATTGPYAGDNATAQGLSASSLSSGSQYFDTVARLVADVADALEHAHQKGVSHRDIKPSNLLLSQDGKLSVTDFGLARVLDEPGLTTTGEFLGTPAYMSPEQVTAGRTPVDHRTDVYSLGAALYELLTLQPPFWGERRDQVLAQIIHKEPRPPRRVAPKVPIDLETVCLKALEKDPDRRYQTAGELADDLRRYVNRFAIAARRPGPVQRLAKWLRRNPALAALLGGLLVALLVAGVFAYQMKVAQGRLHEELQQAAVDRAVLEALSGDPSAALQAIGEAEEKGAEPGQLNLVRGLVEQQRGRPKEALVYLKQAEKQLPDSAAVKALLAKAYMEADDYEQFDEMYALLERLELKTPEDHLFLGLSLFPIDPVGALRALDGAPARSRQSNVARLIRALAQTALAQMTGRVEEAERALDDLHKVDLPDNPLLLSARVRGHLVAAHTFSPKDPRRDEALKNAARDVERLAAYRDNSSAVTGRCEYYFVRGDEGALLEEVRQARVNGVPTPYQVTDFEFSVLYSRKRFAEILRGMQTKKYADQSPSELILQGVALVAIPGRTKEAEKCMTDGVRSYKGGGVLAYMIGYLHLLGPEYREKTRQVALEIRERSSQLIPNARDRWYHDLLAFHAGLLTAEGLERKAGESRFNQCEAYHYIGLRSLAEGKRAEAKSNFTRSFQTGVFPYTEYTFSRAYLALIDDPTWLPWVPMPQEQPKP
jgi:serine/threonine protein kinase